MEYDIEELMKYCVEVYCSLAKVERSPLPMVATPFLHASTKDDGLGGLAAVPPMTLLVPSP
eukprot:12911128-Prorocentrum_lima.AAC.1